MVISKPPGPTLKQQMDDLKKRTKSIKRKSDAMQKELDEMTRTLSRTSRNIVLLRRASFSYRVTRHRVLDVYYHYSCILSTGIVSLPADDGKLVMAGYEPDCVTDAFLYENGERGDWRVFFALYGVGHQRVTELSGGEDYEYAIKTIDCYAGLKLKGKVTTAAERRFHAFLVSLNQQTSFSPTGKSLVSPFWAYYKFWRDIVDVSGS